MIVVWGDYTMGAESMHCQGQKGGESMSMKRYLCQAATLHNSTACHELTELKCAWPARPGCCALCCLQTHGN
jgi:hypothetical protein